MVTGAVTVNGNREPLWGAWGPFRLKFAKDSLDPSEPLISHVIVSTVADAGELFDLHRIIIS